MNVKIEIKITNKNTGFSVASTTSSSEGTLKDVLEQICIDAGYTLYLLDPPNNEEALKLLTIMSELRIIHTMLKKSIDEHNK